MNVHEVTISRSELLTVRAGGRVSAMTDKGLEVRLTDARDKPADKLNVDSRGVIWLPVSDSMNTELIEKGKTGFAPDYVNCVFGIQLDT